MIELQTICYSVSWITKEVHEAVSRVSHMISDTARLEDSIISDIGQYLNKEGRNVRNRRYIRRIIYSKISVAKRRNRAEIASFLHDEGYAGEDGTHVEYEPVDDLAVVNSDKLELKETVALLAQGDDRKKFILKAWANGYHNDKELSSILADTFGGKAPSQRIYIQRFRNDCQAKISAVAI